MTTQTHFRTCNLCEAMCGLTIEAAGNKILSIKGNPDDPLSHGHICPKATALQDIYEDPDRLKRPVRRTKNGWEEIGWEEAFDIVVERLQAIQAAHGRNSVGIYLGNPIVHNSGSMLFAPSFIRALRTRNRFSATSVDQLPHQFAAYLMFGHQFLLPLPDIDRTDFMLILGANPLTSNGSLMTAPGVGNRLKKIQGRGGKVVVVDPRRTETARVADKHLFIRPGRDVFLLLGMLHVMVEEGLGDTGRLSPHITGLDQLDALVAPYSPEAVADATGISAAEIRHLTHKFCAAESAVIYSRMGTSVQAFGGVTTWLVNVLNIVSGNFDRIGGAMFNLPAFDVVGLSSLLGSGKGSHGRWHSRVRQLPETIGELPVSAMAEEMLTPGEGQIKGMVTLAGNPVLSTPNGGQLDQAFEGLDFMVSIDIYINETTRHADIILPPTTGLETSHYDIVFHGFAVRNTATYAEPICEPAEDAMADWEILHALRCRLQGNRSTARQDRRDLFAHRSPEQLIDLALRYGPYGHRYPTEVVGDGLKLRHLKANPHGIDFGPMKAGVLPERLQTSDKRIQLVPEEMLGDMVRVEQTLRDIHAVEPAEFDLMLIGRRQLRSNNSWMHNASRLMRGKDRCTLLIHPEDAAKRGLARGVNATIASRVGSVTLPIELSNEMMPGVVSIPHGFGHGRKGVRMKVAQASAGVSINDLTDEQEIDVLTGNAVLNGVPVRVCQVV